MLLYIALLNPKGEAPRKCVGGSYRTSLAAKVFLDDRRILGLKSYLERVLLCALLHKKRGCSAEITK